MELPGPRYQLRWGFGAAALIAVLILVLAFVPDPFFRQRLLATQFDDVDGVAPGAAVYFRGAQVGTVRSVDLDPASRLFDVGLGIRRDWTPSACSFARIEEANPLATPRIELVAVETSAASCPAARLAAACDPLAVASRPDRDAVTGCRRGAGLFQIAASAVAEAATAAHSTNQMVARLSQMLGGGSGASGVDMAKIAQDSTAALTALSGISQRLNAGLAPGTGDIALTLANVKRASGRAGDFDMAALNDTMRKLNGVIAQNQENVAGLLAEGHATSVEAHGLALNLASSLANLQRTTDNLAALTERLSTDPTYVLRGRKFADPPPPGNSR